MSKLWNMMSDRQRKELQDVIRFGLLAGGMIAMIFAAIKPEGNAVIGIAGAVWCLIWWAVQCFYERPEKEAPRRWDAEAK